MFIYNSCEWARDKRFDGFWRSQEAVEKWMKSHQEMARRAEKIAEVSTKSGNGKKKSKKKVNCVNDLPSVSQREPEIENPEIMEVEEEISEEMQAFFEKTREHRRKRDEIRAEELRKKQWLEESCDEYISVDKIKIRGRVHKSSKAVDEQAATNERREDARKKYGDKADCILAFESLLDVKFEKEYAERRPQMWPNIPLRF